MSIADQVFGAANRLSELAQRRDKMRSLSRSITIAGIECGSCAKWMKASCPREVKGDMSGFSRGPSCAAVKCDQFVMSDLTAKTVAGWKDELATLERQA